MIAITRTQARQFRAVLRKATPLGSPQAGCPMVTLKAGQDGLRIQGQYEDVAVEWHLAGPRPADVIVLPDTALRDLEGRDDTVVELSFKSKSVIHARWEDGGVAQHRDYAAGRADTLPAFPSEPNNFVALDAAFRKAFDDAAHAGSKGVRRPLTRLLLRGKAGEMVGTDSQQLLVQRGFAFPWKEDVLIPAIAALMHRELAHDGPVAIGRTETHVVIRVGPSMFFLAIDKHARFPRFEQVMPSRTRIGTTLQIGPEDAAVLTQALARLPEGREEQTEVTVDLSGPIAIRAKDGEGPPVEWRLTHSTLVGPPVRFVSYRRFLAQALKLGFTQFHVASPTTPIVCRDKRRIYLWMPLNPEAAILPSGKTVRLNPIAPTQAPVSPSIQSRRTNPMPTPISNGHAAPAAPDSPAGRGERPMAIVDLIAEAEQLRTVVLDASARLARLLSGLKQHRRQNRAVQAAMQSLKQIKLDL